MLALGTYAKLPEQLRPPRGEPLYLVAERVHVLVVDVHEVEDRAVALREHLLAAGGKRIVLHVSSVE